MRRTTLATPREREHPFDEIVTLSGRVKLTISVYLQEMASRNRAGEERIRANPSAEVRAAQHHGRICYPGA